MADIPKGAATLREEPFGQWVLVSRSTELHDAVIDANALHLKAYPSVVSIFALGIGQRALDAIPKAVLEAGG